MGGVRTALYNYLFAKRHGGTFILRIEDTDQTRYVPGAEEYIQESLRWTGILPDEGAGFGGEYGPYRQSERKGMYRQYADQLLESGHAYYAFDTSEELEAMRERLKKAKVASPQYNAISRESMKNSLSLGEDEVKRRLDNGDPYVIRFKMPRNEEVRVNDKIRGWVVVNTAQLDDKVLFKSDGMPTYHLANIVDDHLMKISHVIRGEEWLPSAPLHVLLYEAFGWERPEFAHLPLLLKPDGNGKLSKRDGDRLGFPVFPLEWNDPKSGETMAGYRENGYYPEAFVNMLAMLGWNPGTPQEVFSMDELIESFSLERVGKAGAKFDPDKAKWFNQQYLRARSNEELAEKVKPVLEENGVQVSDKFIAGACGLMKERASFVPELYTNGKFLYERPVELDEKTLRKKWGDDSEQLVNELKKRFSELEEFNAPSLEAAFKKFLEEKELKMGAMLPLLRVLVTGQGMGPSMFAIMELLGAKETFDRMDLGIKMIHEWAE